ncbi:MAG: sensor histidine kinase [Sphingobium sp.]
MTANTPFSAEARHQVDMESDSLLAAIVRSSADAIVSKDLDSIVMSWNPAATRIFGFAAEEMIGESIRKLIPDELQYEEDMILERVRTGQQVEPFETIRLSASGERIPVSITVSPIKDTAGRIIGASKTARDLRERSAMAAKLRDTEQRFQLLADNMSQFAWIAEADGPIYWYNKRWYDYTGTTIDQMKGWGWQAVHHPDHVDRVTKLFQQRLAAGEEWEDVFPLRSAEGEYRWFLSRAMPIRDESGKVLCWFGTNTDITEERRQREKIDLLMREIGHRSKNMFSMVQALARRTAPSDQAEFVARFEQRLQALAANQDLLISGNWTGAKIDDLVRTQLSYVDDLIGNRISASGPPLVLTPASAETIGMAMHELVTNAAKYGALSGNTGVVTISWSIEESDGEQFFLLEWRESGGPPVSPPKQEGFGSTVVNRLPAMSLNAEVKSSFDEAGFSWSLRCKARRVIERP